MRRFFTLLSLSCLACAGGEPAEPPPQRDREVAEPAPETVSLLGEPLYAPRRSPETAALQKRQLDEALEAYRAAPDDADAAIWAGRRTAYTGRYREAVALYSEGIEKHPEDPRLYRHRGHRYITLRSFEDAVADLTKASELIRGRPDEVEPDGQPNARNIPVSTLQSNIWYHLGLAHFLSGQWREALVAYEEGALVSKNPDQKVSNSYWQVQTLWRLGRDEEARALLDTLPQELELLENHGYHRLLLLFQGSMGPEEVDGPGEAGTSLLENATLGFGVAVWHAREGREEEALKIWRSLAGGPRWDAFGQIAAEAEVARRSSPGTAGPSPDGS